jgi:EmrB/QacA subfamily drug resistance transporter
MSLPSIVKRFIPPIISLAMFMEALDTTVINTAIPTMAESLKVGPVDLKIALISYLLSLAIFIPISGWLADKFGMKKIFMIAMTIFTVSSIFCGFSNNLWELVIARTVQGLGGALMVPVGRLMILKWFDRTELVQTMNKIIVPALIGPALGPLLGGWITETFSWRWIFWVNIPFGILTLLLAYYFLPESRAEKIEPFDKIGFILFGLGLAGFTFGLSGLSEETFQFKPILEIIFASLILLGIYSLRPKRHHLLRIRTFRLSIMGNIFTRLGFGAMPFLLPLMLQIPLGYSPQFSGLIVAMTAIGAMFVKSFSRDLLAYFGFKYLLLINTILLGLSLSLFSTLTSSTSVILMILYGLICGFLASLQFSGMNPLAFSETLPQELSHATSIHSVTIQISQSFSVALSALVLKNVGVHHLTLKAFHLTFLIFSIITMLASSVFLFMQKNDGANLIGEK